MSELMENNEEIKKTSPYLYIILRPIFTAVFRILFRPTYINKEVIPKDGPVVLAGNHKHALDPIFVNTSTKRVVHTLAKKELHDGAFGWFFKAVGTIPVDFTKKKNKSALDTAIAYLKDGYAVNVSPEAGRNYTKEILLPFKPGAVVMGKRAECPVIPYSITGDYKIFKNKLTICYGEPMDFSDTDVEEANALLFDEVKELLIKNKTDKGMN